MVRKRNPTSARIGRVEDPSNGLMSAKDWGVWMFSVEVTAAEPGVTFAGVKVAVAPEGKPEAVKTTALANAPPCGLTLIV